MIKKGNPKGLSFFMFKVQSSKFKVQGSKFKVQGSKFKVQGWAMNDANAKFLYRIFHSCVFYNFVKVVLP